MDVLKTILEYIKENHPDAGLPEADGICYKVNSDSRRKLGYSRSVYSGGGWDISIGRPVTPQKVYNVKAEYQNGDIVWVGRIINGKAEEKSYENISKR